MQQAEDFRAESQALFELLDGAEAGVFDARTLFKSWTIDAVLQHLHFWNQMAGLQLTNEALLLERIAGVMSHPGGMRDYENAHLQGLSGRALLAAWRAGFEATADAFVAVDPKRRLKWPGPDMSARSSITARLMETWAHGQAVYDRLGVVRQNADRVQNIVVLGVNTFGWTYATRQESPPGPMPQLVLTAPSGQVWTHGEPSATERIEGRADEFCQVVTQTRNVADTSLRVTGAVAKDWMSKAQCFAGPPETPPAPGTRKAAAPMNGGL
jgi:uncharacterized protein (TIGR03084 family)